MSTLPTLVLEDATLGQPHQDIQPANDRKEDTLDEKSPDANALVTRIDPELIPTAEDLATLRKVSGPVSWVGIALCLVEFAERASYYGVTGPFNNFLSNPLPDGGNGAGAVAKGQAGLNQSAGALGQGSVITTALLTMFEFLAYVTPVGCAILSDTKWGRFKTIWIGTILGFFAHIVLVIPAIPSVIAKPQGSVGAFAVSIIFLSFASGLIKPTLSPLFNDQNPVKVPTIKYLKSGEKVIVDPQVTIERYTMIFYCVINFGAFFSIATSYAERFVGFWFAFLLPGLLYLMMPLVLISITQKLYKAPPQDTVMIEAFRVFRVLFSNGGWRRMFRKDWWDAAKPSHNTSSALITWDDKFVDEIRQALGACVVFFIIPIFSVSDAGIGNSLNSMSVAMTLDGVPNDLISNLNPLALVLFSPVLTYGLYPFMAKRGHPLKPMTRMCIGYWLGALGGLAGALVQWRIYKTSPCGYEASTCEDVSPVSLWWITPILVLGAVGELFVFVTSYELAYTRAPARLKSLVYSLALFSVALGAALSLACSAVIQDPYLIWPWSACAIACAVTSFLFPTVFKHLNEPIENFADEARMEGRDQVNEKQLE